MQAARKIEGHMNRKRKNTEEFLNPWAGEAGWKTDPRSFSVVSGSHKVKRRRKNTGGPRNIEKRIPKQQIIPFNWLQLTTAFLGLVAFGLMAYLASVMLMG